MIDIDKYKIADDVVWIWKEDLAENYDMIKDYPKSTGWVLWEYKECPAEKGGYTLDGYIKTHKTYEPWNQVLPALRFGCEIDEKMMAIMDLPLILAEVKRLRNKLFEAEVHIDPLTDDYTFENDIRELHYIEGEMIE